MIRVLFLASVIVLTQTVFATAQQCGSGFCHNQVFSKNVAVVQQKVVDFTPVHVAFVPSQVLLNGQMTLYQNQQNTSGLGYSYQGPAVTAPNVAAGGDRLDKIESQLNAMIQAWNKVYGDNGNVEVPGGDGADITSMVTTIFDNNCKKCHGFDSEKSDLLMYDVDGRLLDKLPRYKIYYRMTLPGEDECSMPKNTHRLPVEQLEIIRQWVHNDLQSLKY